MRNTSAALVVLAVCVSCSLLDVPSPDAVKTDSGDHGTSAGSISFSFSRMKGTVKAGAGVAIDTNSFLLSVVASDGSVLYRGEYCDAPGSIRAEAGTYIVSAISSEFSRPSFDAPQWGDEQVVIVEAGCSVHVELVCRQMNCGVRLHPSQSLMSSYPSAVLRLDAADGELPYSYGERRIAYFLPGLVSLKMIAGGTEAVLLTRLLDPGEILDLDVTVASGAGCVSVQLDTSRTYVRDTCEVDECDIHPGMSPDNPLSVTQARASVGMKGVWVEGFAAGGDLTRNGAAFSPPFASRTNLVLGPRRTVSDRDQCVAVELKQGTVRNSLNLVDNPELFGTRLCLKCDIDPSYFGLVGLKNVTDFIIR